MFQCICDFFVYVKMLIHKVKSINTILIERLYL